MKADHGLTPRQLAEIRKIVREHTGAVQEVCLYGSRAQGTHRPNSNIDLVLHGRIDSAVEDRLWTCFHESSLPHRVDVTVYDNIRYEPLRRHIDQKQRRLFSREELYGADA